MLDTPELVYILTGLFAAHIVLVRLQLRQLRRDILNVTKNARQARVELLSKRAYKNLEK